MPNPDKLQMSTADVLKLPETDPRWQTDVGRVMWLIITIFKAAQLSAPSKNCGDGHTGALNPNVDFEKTASEAHRNNLHRLIGIYHENKDNLNEFLRAMIVDSSNSGWVVPQASTALILVNTFIQKGKSVLEAVEAAKLKVTVREDVGETVAQ